MLLITLLAAPEDEPFPTKIKLYYLPPTFYVNGF